MTVEAQNKTIFAGDSIELDFTAYETDGETPLDLTGATVLWQMRAFRLGDAIIDKQTDAGITVDSPPTGGQFVVLLEPIDTQSIAHGRYPHAAVVIDGLGNVSTIATGFIVVRPAATVTIT